MKQKSEASEKLEEFFAFFGKEEKKNSKKLEVIMLWNTKANLLLNAVEKTKV